MTAVGRCCYDVNSDTRFETAHHSYLQMYDMYTRASIHVSDVTMYATRFCIYRYIREKLVN